MTARLVGVDGRAHVARAVFALLLAFSAIRCGRSEPDAGASLSSAPARPAQAQAPGAPMPHGDHNPHHGGVVMMKGDLHFEVVSNPAGRYHVYFTDASRADLPAATARSVTLTIHRGSAPDEPIPMRIDESGESWEGSGQPVANVDDATVRVGFTVNGEQPYWIDLPYRIPGA